MLFYLLMIFLNLSAQELTCFSEFSSALESLDSFNNCKNTVIQTPGILNKDSDNRKAELDSQLSNLVYNNTENTFRQISYVDYMANLHGNGLDSNNNELMNSCNVARFKDDIPCLDKPGVKKRFNDLLSGQSGVNEYLNLSSHWSFFSENKNSESPPIERCLSDKDRANFSHFLNRKQISKNLMNDVASLLRAVNLESIADLTGDDLILHIIENNTSSIDNQNEFFKNLDSFPMIQSLLGSADGIRELKIKFAPHQGNLSDQNIDSIMKSLYSDSGNTRALFEKNIGEKCDKMFENMKNYVCEGPDYPGVANVLFNKAANGFNPEEHNSGFAVPMFGDADVEFRNFLYSCVGEVCPTSPELPTCENLKFHSADNIKSNFNVNEFVDEAMKEVGTRGLLTSDKYAGKLNDVTAPFEKLLCPMLVCEDPFNLPEDPSTCKKQETPRSFADLKSKLDCPKDAFCSDPSFVLMNEFMQENEIISKNIIASSLDGSLRLNGSQGSGGNDQSTDITEVKKNIIISESSFMTGFLGKDPPEKGNELADETQAGLINTAQASTPVEQAKSEIESQKEIPKRPVSNLSLPDHKRDSPFKKITSDNYLLPTQNEAKVSSTNESELLAKDMVERIHNFIDGISENTGSFQDTTEFEKNNRMPNNVSTNSGRTQSFNGSGTSSQNRVFSSNDGRRVGTPGSTSSGKISGNNYGTTGAVGTSGSQSSDNDNDDVINDGSTLYPAGHPYHINPPGTSPKNSVDDSSPSISSTGNVVSLDSASDLKKLSEEKLKKQLKVSEEDDIPTPFIFKITVDGQEIAVPVVPYTYLGEIIYKPEINTENKKLLKHLKRTTLFQPWWDYIKKNKRYSTNALIETIEAIQDAQQL